MNRLIMGSPTAPSVVGLAERVRDVAALVRLHEGTGPMRAGRLLPYQDTVGKWTIGFGRNLTDRGISVREADDLLLHDLAETIAALRDALPWFDGLTEVRQAALIDMGYNLGVRGLLAFRRTLAALRDGRWADAAAAMLDSKWAEQVGARARRDAAMVKTGDWP